MAKDAPRKRYPSREGIKYIPIPAEWWDILEQLGEPDERSVSYMGRRAVREFLERAGKLPKPKDRNA